MLDDNQDRLTASNPNRRDSGIGTGMWAAIAAAVVLVLVFMWAPWSGPRTADNGSPGTTVGSSANRPAAPAAPTAPAPSPPAAPSTTR
jgi:hypothetical protein